MQDFYQLFVTELKDMFGSEQQIIKALPTVIKEVRDQKLKAALRHHLNETKAQTKRIKQIADALNINLGRAHCEAMAGILKEGSKLIHQYRSEVKDAAIICSCQRVEHYEIAVYGTLITFAKILKFKNVEKLLKKRSTRKLMLIKN